MTACKFTSDYIRGPMDGERGQYGGLEKVGGGLKLLVDSLALAEYPHGSQTTIKFEADVKSN